MNNLIYFIQGIYFFKAQWLRVGFHGIVGAIAQVDENETCEPFYGVINSGHKENDLSEAPGYLVDRFGEAEISSLHFSGNKLEFEKKYNHRNYLIKYSLKKVSDNVWEGKYNSKGEIGIVRCILTPAPKDFFENKLS